MEAVTRLYYVHNLSKLSALRKKNPISKAGKRNKAKK